LKGLFVTKIEKQYERFRELITEARKSAGLTQVEVAARLKQHQSYVSKYESGVRRLDVVEYIQVAKAVGFDPAELIRRLAEG
jgi:transcriptional regulator with XRE-family HTH domain